MKTGLRKEDSLTIKGCAVLLMMTAHCFLKGRASAYTISYFPFTESSVSTFAEFSRIFVSFFAFVSGYGMFLSYNSEKKSNTSSVLRWIKERYLKSFMPMQFCIVFIWIVTFFLDRLPVAVYFKEGPVMGLLYMTFNFFGLSDIFSTPKMVGTWWYLTAHVAFVFMIPLFSSALTYFGSVICLGLLMLIPRCINGYPGGMNFVTFLPALMLGMIFAKKDLFAYLDRFIATGKKKAMVAVLSVFLSFVVFRLSLLLPKKYFWDLNLGLFTPVYIVMIRQLLCKVPILSGLLRFIGKHSANIFLIHTFIRNRYLTSFVYNQKHFVLVILTLLLCSLIGSIIIESLKSQVKFDAFQKQLVQKVVTNHDKQFC